jgi:hypothetical protein
MAKHSESPAPADQPGRDGQDIVVFSIIRESACAECGADLWEGSLLRVEGERALCLGCADLDHLVFLPRGDTALTRRASKHSTLRAVVARFSRARKRYERQGILIEEAALEQAEHECLADAAARERARERAAQRRDERDESYLKEFAERLGDLFPGCPVPERQAIADHACQKHSGRIGRSAAAQSFEPRAIELAVRAHVRHSHTHYDQLLASGKDRMDARFTVSDAVESVIERWRQPSSARNG